MITVKVTDKIRNSSECSSERYLLSCWTFYNQTYYGNATLWVSVMQEDWFSVIKFRVTVKVHLIRYMTVSTIYAELLIFLQSNLIGWYIIISLSVLCKNYIVVFKVKTTVQVQNFMEFLCILFHLYHWSRGNQRCTDILFIITNPSRTKWAYTDSSTLTCTRSLGRQWGGYFAVQGDKPCFLLVNTTILWPVKPTA